MRNLFYFVYKGTRKVLRMFKGLLYDLIVSFWFFVYKVEHSSFQSNGLPFLHIERGGSFKIGENFRFNNGLSNNPIGYVQPCAFVVTKAGSLIIGDNVGMSQTTLVCHDRIEVGSFVKFGGGVKIYDTDFHSLDPVIRKDSKLDLKERRTKPVIISDNVFIGAGAIVLKGVTIGANSIIGAGSVVSKSIPPNEIWGGNPAKFIKSIL